MPRDDRRSAPPVLRVRAGKERPILQGHPWVFSGAIANLDPSLEPGTIVSLVAEDGTFLGRGYANPRCAIAVRVLSRDDVDIDAAWIGRRVSAAVELRRTVVPPGTTAWRVLNGEGDGLPGVVADRYGDLIVLQCITAGAARMRDAVVAALVATLRPGGIFERSAGRARRDEGLGDAVGVLHGRVPDDSVVVKENGLRFAVDVRGGQKTGFFLDQRDNRAACRALASGRSVLNAFGYTGAFSVYAGAGGAARVMTVDSSAPALDLARANWERNALPAERADWAEADVFHFLRECEEPWDLLVLDPPALVKQRHDVDRGARAYKDLNLQGLRRAAAGAFVMTFSCSQHIEADLFTRIVRAAAQDAERTVQVLQHLGPGRDHPTLLGHPEAGYLKGLLLRVA